MVTDSEISIEIFGIKIDINLSIKLDIFPNPKLTNTLESNVHGIS